MLTAALALYSPFLGGMISRILTPKSLQYDETQMTTKTDTVTDTNSMTALHYFTSARHVQSSCILFFLCFAPAR